LPPQGARHTKPLLGVAQGLALWARIFTNYHPLYFYILPAQVERCWGILEEYWNGELLDSISKAVNWACTMTWKGINPVVTLVKKSYKKGIRLTKKEITPYNDRIKRSCTLPKWDVVIEPGDE
jgi:hypothetical protein